MSTDDDELVITITPEEVQELTQSGTPESGVKKPEVEAEQHIEAPKPRGAGDFAKRLLGGALGTLPYIPETALSLMGQAGKLGEPTHVPAGVHAIADIQSQAIRHALTPSITENQEQMRLRRLQEQFAERNKLSEKLHQQKLEEIRERAQIAAQRRQPNEAMAQKAREVLDEAIEMFSKQDPRLKTGNLFGNWDNAKLFNIYVRERMQAFMNQGGRR